MHQQSAGFTRLPPWDFEASREKYPLLLHAPYFDLYRRQVIKQADLLLAQYWFGDRFDDENKARNVDYYERRTVRDSSLSAAVQAVTAAEVGHLELAYDYVYEAAQIDLRDLDHNSGDGMHIASLASVWTALVAGFGGLREYQGQLSFAPQLPDLITRLSFTVQWRGQRLEVDIEPGRATDVICASQLRGSPVEKLWPRGVAGLTHDLEAGAVEHAGRTFAQQTSSAASTTRVRTVVTPTIKG